VGGAGGPQPFIAMAASAGTGVPLALPLPLFSAASIPKDPSEERRASPLSTSMPCAAPLTRLNRALDL
jgi:hypothetical protein